MTLEQFRAQARRERLAEEDRQRREAECRALATPEQRQAWGWLQGTAPVERKGL